MNERLTARLRVNLKRQIRRAGLPLGHDFVSTSDLEKILGFIKQRNAAVKLIAENQQAWEGEEDSVKQEHKELLLRNGMFLESIGAP
jgi:hypothetical protein